MNDLIDQSLTPVCCNYCGKAGKDMFCDFDCLKKLVKNTREEAYNQGREDLAEELLAKGHGGGNWRRLAIQLSSKQSKDK